jgi:iron complex transport system permease protein
VNPNRRLYQATVLLVFSGIVLLAISLLWGGGGALWYLPESDRAFMLWSFRLPASIMAILAGAGLAFSGLVMQNAFRNPLAGPFVLGISSGAGLGVALVVLAGYAAGTSLGNIMPVRALAAMFGAMGMMALNLLVIRYIGSTATLLIFGILAGHFVSALTELLQVFAGGEELKRFLLWGMGSVQIPGWTPQGLIFLLLAVSVWLIWKKADAMDVYQLGDDYAASLGLDVRKYRLQWLLAAAVVAGAITAYCGPLSFVGLIIPHAARIFSKQTRHRLLLPFCLLCGAVFMLTAHILSVLPWSGMLVPVNIVCSVMGAPVVVFLLLRNRVQA